MFRKLNSNSGSDTYLSSQCYILKPLSEHVTGPLKTFSGFLIWFGWRPEWLVAIWPYAVSALTLCYDYVRLCSVPCVSSAPTYHRATAHALLTERNVFPTFLNKLTPTHPPNTAPEFLDEAYPGFSYHRGPPFCSKSPCCELQEGGTECVNPQHLDGAWHAERAQLMFIALSDG